MIKTLIRIFVVCLLAWAIWWAGGLLLTAVGAPSIANELGIGKST